MGDKVSLEHPDPCCITSWIKPKNGERKTIKMCGDFTPFIGKSFQMWDHFFLLIFPNDSESLKFLDLQLWELAAKRRWNSTSKVNRRTDRQTDTGGHFDLKKASAHTSLYFIIFVLDLIVKPFCSFKLLNNQRFVHTKHENPAYRDTESLGVCG